MFAGPGFPVERRDDLVIYDVAPTILELFGLSTVAGARRTVSSLAQEPERA